MSSLSEYNPLAQISIKDVHLIAPKGIVLVVGPNSSGKSLFLKDIDNYLTLGTNRFTVCSEILGNMPLHFDTFFEDLVRRNYLRLVPGHNDQFRTYIPFFGSKDINNRQRVAFSRAELSKAYSDCLQEHKKGRGAWFRYVGITTVAQLGIDERRQLCNKARTFLLDADTPDEPVQSLFLNSEAQEALSRETANVFRNAAWLDISDRDHLQLRVAGTKTLPPIGKMNNPMESRHFRGIESEGDGYRSYVSMCVSILVGIRPVTLIDEPELCLHPPQAYHIGRFIGSNTNEDHVTFVATHSSHVLRGIIETSKHLTVLRLTNSKEGFSAHRIAHDQLVEIVRNPRSRTETIFDGVFSRGVVLVESEGDREVYQAAVEAIPDSPALEIHFVPVGGIGGFVAPLRFYKSLNIPVAIIADFDAICDPAKLESLYNEMCSNANKRSTTIENIGRALSELKAISPTVDVKSVQTKLTELSTHEMNWNRGDDNVLRKELAALERSLRRLNRIKTGGIAAYEEYPELHALLLEISSTLREVGIFLVTVGELEDWASGLMQDIPIGTIPKPDRAQIAAERIRLANERSGDVWKFVADIISYLEAASTTNHFSSTESSNMT